MTSYSTMPAGQSTTPAGSTMPVGPPAPSGERPPAESQAEREGQLRKITSLLALARYFFVFVGISYAVWKPAHISFSDAGWTSQSVFELALVTGTTPLLVWLVTKAGERQARRAIRSNRRLTEANEAIRHENEERRRAEAALKDAKEATEEANANLVQANGRLEKETARANRMAAKAQAASRAKGDFLASMSHEIRTPIYGITGMMELAFDTELTPVQRDYLESAQASADALLTVINDVLDFSKIEADTLELQTVPFDAREKLGDTMRSLALGAHEKGLEMVCRVAPSVPQVLVGDADRLRQVVVNLVGNAIKFTERGTIVLDVAVGELQGAGIQMRFSVSDTGIGVPERVRKQIFQPFKQGGSSRKRRFHGTGLGLAISKRLVELMGGSIGVESAPGEGSVFQFTACLEVDAEHAGVPETPSWAPGRRALVIVPNQATRRHLTEVLTAASVAWHTPAEAEEASAALRSKAWDFALIDSSALDPAGAPVLELVAADPLLSGASIVALTAAGHQEVASSAGTRGAWPWLRKPVKESKLWEAVSAALGGQESTSQATARETPQAKTPSGFSSRKTTS